MHPEQLEHRKHGLLCCLYHLGIGRIRQTRSLLRDVRAKGLEVEMRIYSFGCRGFSMTVVVALVALVVMVKDFEVEVEVEIEMQVGEESQRMGWDSHWLERYYDLEAHLRIPN